MRYLTISFLSLLSLAICNNISNKSVINIQSNDHSHVIHYNWFNGNDALIWIQNDGKTVISTNLLYGDEFLLKETYLLYDGDDGDNKVDVDLMYLDNINEKIYVIDTKQENVRIIQYDLKYKNIVDLYDCTKDECKDVAVLFNCSADICSLFVDENIMYFATQFGYFYMDLDTFYFNQISLNIKNTDYANYTKLRVYDGYLYLMINDIGILKKRSSSFEDLNSDLSQILIHRKACNVDEITSFVIDISRDIMYFSSNDGIYQVEMNSNHLSVSPMRLNIKLNASRVNSLELNKNGTMLFIHYSITNKSYIINWPTPYGCILCKFKATPKTLSNNISDALFYHSPRTSSKEARKLLAEFSPWFTSNVPLLHKDSEMAIGCFNNSIFLIGGTQNGFQLTEYDIINNTMIDHGSSVVLSGTYGNGQFYTQINEIVYMIDPVGDKLSIYNLNTKTFVFAWNNIVIPTNVADRSCLADINNFLFVVGGLGSGNAGLGTFQILNVSANSWLDGALMHNKRRALSCNVHPITLNLYAIGGVHGSISSAASYVTQIERIYVGGNISNETWTILEDFMLPSFGPRSVVFGDEILIIGGEQVGQYRIQIQTINCISQHVTEVASSMDYAVRGSAVFVLNDTIYVFGGYNGGYLDTWQYSILARGPTSQPTNSPTKEPTLSSISPTSQPTNSPTKEPTLPSISPTNKPTNSPTKEPTLPSISPTVFPSISSGCLLFNASFDDDITNGYNYYVDIVIEDNEYLYQTSTTDARIIYKVNEEYKYYLQPIPCSNSTMNANECYIECLAKESCMESTIKPLNKLSVLYIKCSDIKSCMKSKLIIDNINVDNILLICNSSLSCNHMNININHNTSLPLQTLTIYCLNSFSCNGMNIDIIGQNNIQHPYNEYKIICQAVNSCDNIILKEKDINVTTMLYEYSADITIINDFGFSEDSIICGLPSNTTRIRYDINDYKISSQEIYIEAQSLYTFNKFPCQDIIFQCLEYDDEFCEVLYEFNTPSSIIPIDYSSGILCYDINIYYLQSITCSLNCNAENDEATKNETYYLFDVIFEYEIVFTDNSSLDTNINLHCKEFFGDKQSTELSLVQINYIFSTSLSLYVYRDYINSINKYPKTKLLSHDDPNKNETFSDCLITNDDYMSIVHLNTYFQVKTVNDTHQHQSLVTLFEQNSFFFNQSVDLLHDYFEANIVIFGVVINETIQEMIPSKHVKSNKYMIWSLVGSISLLIIMVLLFIFYRWKLKRDYEALAVYIKNPMVINIAIGIYDAEKLRDLPVDIDIRNISTLFKDTLNYEMYPPFNRLRNVRLEWNQKDLVLYLFQKAKVLNESNHDSLIFILTGHGIKDYIITSDGKAVSKVAIHRIFSYYYPNNRDKPRIFIYECCAGGNDRNPAPRYSLEQPQGARSLKDDDFEEEKKEDDDRDDVRNYVDGKIIDLDFIKNLSKSDETWNKGEHNPDYQLCEVSAANPDYQSKMSTETGSLWISLFVKQMMDNINIHKNRYFLNDILERIQKILHSKGKQLPIHTLNNDTKYIKFIRNTEELRNVDDIEEHGNDGNNLEQMIKKYIDINNVTNNKKENILIGDIEMTGIEKQASNLEYQQTNNESDSV